MGHLSYRGDHRDRDPRCARAGRALPRPRPGGLSLRLRRARQRGGRRGRHADDLRQRSARARAGREAAQAHELADHDRPQPDPAALPRSRSRGRTRSSSIATWPPPSSADDDGAVDRRSRPGAPADPANQREALVLRELEGRSYKEIASILDVSPTALETLIFRARRSLAEELENWSRATARSSRCRSRPTAGWAGRSASASLRIWTSARAVRASPCGAEAPSRVQGARDRCRCRSR